MQSSTAAPEPQIFTDNARDDDPSPSSGTWTAADKALVNLAQALRERGYRFTTVTPLTQARVNTRPGNREAVDLSGVFGWSRPFRRALLTHDIFDLMLAAKVVDDAGDGRWRSRVRVSTLHKQIFVHSAYPTTDANAVFFGPDTVRFVTAIERHLAERSAPPQRVADIGCGAGPGAIVIAAAAAHADVSMLDINALALRYAQVNASVNGIAARACHSDILSSVPGSFDLIVSNPPYLVDASKRAYRHGGGRFGEGLSLRIVQESLPRLAKGGTLLLYTGAAVVAGRDVFLERCRDILEAAKLRWAYREVDPDVFGEELETRDYADADRIAAVVLTVMNEGLS